MIQTNTKIDCQPLTVDDITAKAINASFCMMSCSDVTMAIMGASPPHFIICSPTSAVGRKEVRK